MKITLITFDNWGFNEHIVNALQNKGHQINHINFSNYKYKYPSVLHRIYNFILKIFFNKNLKTNFYGKKVLEDLRKIKEKQDLILTIKGDFIAPRYASEFKKHTKKSIAFFNDNIKRCPKIINVLPCFDKVYSFEKEDCEKYKLEFKTNFIYNYDPLKTNNIKKEFEVFNISSFGKRNLLILKIAEKLKAIKTSYNFILYDKKNKLKNNDLISIINKPIPLEDITNYIEKSNVLLDIHRKNQQGLSFRAFESMGVRKKLITSNSSIKDYDFYNKNNILIINPENIEIPSSFFSNTYIDVPPAIFNKYEINGWVQEFLN